MATHRRAPIVLLLALVAALSVESLAAQEGHVSLATIERRVDSIRPVTGPPGTLVRVSSREMPSITPIRVGIGGVRSGFESLVDLMTGYDGDFAVTVSVPDWVQWDRVHRFVVFDIYFKPIALSELFHVTNDQGLVRRTGEVQRQPEGCLRLVDVDGVAYGLEGPSEMPSPGTRATVEGRVERRTACGTPYLLRVEHLQVG